MIEIIILFQQRSSQIMLSFIYMLKTLLEWYYSWPKHFILDAEEIEKAEKEILKQGIQETEQKGTQKHFITFL